MATLPWSANAPAAPRAVRLPREPAGRRATATPGRFLPLVGPAHPPPRREVAGPPAPPRIHPLLPAGPPPAVAEQGPAPPLLPAPLSRLRLPLGGRRRPPGGPEDQPGGQHPARDGPAAVA